MSFYRWNAGALSEKVRLLAVEKHTDLVICASKEGEIYRSVVYVSELQTCCASS